MSARLVGWIPDGGRIDTPIGTMARVGATSENDVVVRVDGVSRTHARIVGEQDGYFVEDVNSRNGTWLNGERITRARLRHLDVITLGRFAELVFVQRETGETSVAAAAPAELRVRLEWTEGPTRGTIIDIPRGESLIGRAESCAIIVDSPAISRAHARISNTGDRVVIEDLGSANGTSVDGQSVKGPQTLRPGAEVALGQARRFRVLIDGMSAAAMNAAAPPATPAPAQDMEWATRLVYSVSDREAIARAAGGIDKPSPPPARPVGKSPVAPVTPVATPAAAKPEVRSEPPPRPATPTMVETPAMSAEPKATQLGQPTPNFKVPPAVRSDQPAAKTNQPEAPRTQLGVPGLGKPPAMPVAPPDVGVPKTQLGGPALAPPKKFEPEPPAPAAPDSNNLPGATVLGFREVGPPPRAVGSGTVPVASPGMSSGSGPPPAPPKFDEPSTEETRLGAVPYRRAEGGPAPIAAVQLSGDLGTFTLPLGTSTVGRSTEATIRIDSREVSRIHAIFSVTESEVIVEDRGSVNGTSINGTAITGRRPLVEGDRVSFADFEFRVEVKRTEGN